jgi:hypothetical protein
MVNEHGTRSDQSPGLETMINTYGSPSNSFACPRRPRAPKGLLWVIAGDVRISPLDEARFIINPLAGSWLPPNLVVILLLILETDGESQSRIAFRLSAFSLSISLDRSESGYYLSGQKPALQLHTLSPSVHPTPHRGLRWSLPIRRRHDIAVLDQRTN